MYMEIHEDDSIIIEKDRKKTENILKNLKKFFDMYLGIQTMKTDYGIFLHQE